MDASKLKEELRKELHADIEGLLDEVVQSVNQAEPGRVIADSEEAVRNAAARFREQLYQKVIQIRVQTEGSAFSPSGGGGGRGMAKQRSSGGDVSDNQRPGGD